MCLSLQPRSRYARRWAASLPAAGRDHFTAIQSSTQAAGSIKAGNLKQPTTAMVISARLRRSRHGSPEYRTLQQVLGQAARGERYDNRVIAARTRSIQDDGAQRSRELRRKQLHARSLPLRSRPDSIWRRKGGRVSGETEPAR